MSGTSIVPPTHADSQKSSKRIIAWLTGLLTLLQTSFSFILSFNALADLAANHGISIPVLFPLVVEAGVVIFSLNALYRSIHGENTKRQWCLIIGSSLLAGMFNVLHARPDVVSRVMAAMPSLFLLLSFETFVGQVRYSVTRSSTVQSLDRLEAMLSDKQADFERLQSQIEQLDTDIGKLEKKQTTLRSCIAELDHKQPSTEVFDQPTLTQANKVRLNNKQQAMNALLDFYAEHPNASLKEAGRAVGRAKSTVSNYLDELEADGRVQRNGQGVEVTR